MHFIGVNILKVEPVIPDIGFWKAYSKHRETMKVILFKCYRKSVKVVSSNFYLDAIKNSINKQMIFKEKRNPELYDCKKTQWDSGNEISTRNLNNAKMCWDFAFSS
jgi:hypothetical protein